MFGVFGPQRLNLAKKQVQHIQTSRASHPPQRYCRKTTHPVSHDNARLSVRTAARFACSGP